MDAGGGVDEMIEHIQNCTDVDALLVAQEGSADEMVANLLACGWTLEDRVDRVAGKRIRFMKAPSERISNGLG